MASKAFSNILFVTSRRARINKNDEDDMYDIIPEELDDLHEKITEIEEKENSVLVDPNLKDISIAHIANVIETRFIEPHRIKCEPCKNVFNENQKINKAVKQKPCESTFSICKETDRYLKFQLLNDDIKINTIYYAIFQQLDVNLLFPDTDFSHDSSHKLHLIRGIIDAYIQIKGTHLAKTATFGLHQQQLRFKLRKLIHYHGQ